MRALLAVAFLSVAPLAVAHSQSFEAFASATTLQNHLYFTSTRAEQTGVWLSAEGVVKFRKLRGGLSSSIGSLSGEDDGINPDRSARSTALLLGMQATPWLALGATAEARRFDTDAGISVWRLIGANLRFTPTVVPDAIEGLIDVSFWPAAEIIDGETMGIALRTIVGATYRVRGGPLGIRLAYRFERFDFDVEEPDARYEQFRGATLGAVMRFGR